MLKDILNANIYFEESTRNIKITPTKPFSGQVSLLDVQGRTILVKDGLDSNNDINISVNNLSSGIYILNLLDNKTNQTFTDKIYIK